MMKQMRENTKVILWIVVVAFVVTIFAVWGLDLRGPGSAGPGQYNVIGEVNGTEITRNHYQAVYEQLASQMRQAQPDGNLSYAQQEMIREQAWDNLVSSILTSQEIENLGITVTDDEVVSYLMTSPPPEIQQYFVNDEGEFDYAAYQAALQNPEADWTAVESLARERIPLIKLNAYLASQVHVSPEEVRHVFEEEHTLITAQYVSFPLSAQDISEYAPTDEQIQAYYEDHADDFRRGERAAVEYVRIPIEPTAADLDDLMYTANTLSDQIAAGEDFAEIARVYSQAPTASVGGETGFITADRRDTEVMTRVAIMNEGQVSEPIQTEDGVYLVELLEKEEEDGETKYNIRELFLELSAGRETVDSLITLARDLRESAGQKGLADAAADLGLTARTTEPFQRQSPIAGLGFVPSINRFAFNNDPGVISNVIGDEDDYFIVRVAERLPASVQPIEEVRTVIEERLKNERRKSLARRKADGFYRKLSTSPATFEEAAEDYGLEIIKPEAFRYVDSVEGMPPRSPFAYAALRLQPGAVSPPIESGGAYVILQLIERSPFDEEEFINRAPAIANRLRQEKARAYLSYWYESLKEEAEIKDFRENV